jgi:serum/glucocorticoid-regulated kinase 2
MSIARSRKRSQHPNTVNGRNARAALDRDLSDANDEDDVRMERDEEDEDWDFIEADGEDRNGTRGNNLFARGVVDRYSLAVFRKGSTLNAEPYWLWRTGRANGTICAQ